MSFGPLESGKLFGRDNFIHWMDQLFNYFEAINLKQALATDQADDRARECAMELIRFYMEPSEQPIIAQCHDPREAIRLLMRAYYPNSLVNHAKIRADIAKTEHEGVGKTARFISKLCFHYRELRYSGAMVETTAIMATIMFKLPPDFEFIYPKLNQTRDFGRFIDLLKEADDDLAWEQTLKYTRRFDRERKEYMALVMSCNTKW